MLIEIRKEVSNILTTPLPVDPVEAVLKCRGIGTRIRVLVYDPVREQLG